MSKNTHNPVKPGELIAVNVSCTCCHKLAGRLQALSLENEGLRAERNDLLAKLERIGHLNESKLAQQRGLERELRSQIDGLKNQLRAMEGTCSSLADKRVIQSLREDLESCWIENEGLKADRDQLAADLKRTRDQLNKQEADRIMHMAKCPLELPPLAGTFLKVSVCDDPFKLGIVDGKDGDPLFATVDARASKDSQRAAEKHRLWVKARKRAEDLERQVANLRSKLDNRNRALLQLKKEQRVKDFAGWLVEDSLKLANRPFFFYRGAELAEEATRLSPGEKLKPETKWKWEGTNCRGTSVLFEQQPSFTPDGYLKVQCGDSKVTNWLFRNDADLTRCVIRRVAP